MLFNARPRPCISISRQNSPARRLLLLMILLIIRMHDTYIDILRYARHFLRRHNTPAKRANEL